MTRIMRRKAEGAAVLAAMLVVAIAASLAAQVFERQQLAVRTIENRMDASQIRWIERAASDWARLVLRLDARTTTIDHLGEPWAMAIQQTELDPTLKPDLIFATCCKQAIAQPRIHFRKRPSLQRQTSKP
jgi:general secretion pathway protein K